MKKFIIFKLMFWIDEILFFLQYASIANMDVIENILLRL